MPGPVRRSYWRRSRWLRRGAVALSSLLLWAVPVLAQRQSVEEGLQAALALIEAQPTPVFAEDHGLPPLSQWRSTHYDLQKLLAEQWGYALHFGRVTDSVVANLEDPESAPRQLLALTAADPERYPLHVIIAPAGSIKSFMNAGFPEDAFIRDADGKLVEDRRRISPLAPDSCFEMLGDHEGELVKAIRKYAPIALVTNGGEYGINASGHSAKCLAQDPRVMQAKGDRPWREFLADHRARHDRLIRERVKRAVPDLPLYIYYTATACGHPHRNRYDGWDQWGFVYRPGTSDIPSGQSYYMHYTSGFTGDNDLLTQFLNGRAQEIAAGEPLSYNWMSPGWVRRSKEEQDGPVADAALWLGYLKCVYTAGAIGNVHGYFGANPLQDPIEKTVPPMLALAHAHALFTHLEDLLRNGDLLPGPDKHRWSTDLPAYEFPTGEATVRVLVRKHRDEPRWLITAWSADGETRSVKVTVPDLGEVSVEAHAAGCVYVASKNAAGEVEFDRQDPTPEDPTATWRR
ncbi:MAG: hypothetical protein ACE5JM_02145 [Armatimonadota bacterium]